METNHSKKENLKPITVKLSSNEIEELGAHAKAASLNRSEYIRQAIFRSSGDILQKKNSIELASALNEMIDIKSYLKEKHVSAKVISEVEERMKRVWDLCS